MNAADVANVADVAEVARQCLKAGASGLSCAHLAVGLAEAVLDGANVQLALKVLEGGPFAHARATRVARQTALLGLSDPF